MSTQQGWSFLIGDGAPTEVFTLLGGLYEMPEFTPNQFTTRDETTIGHVASSNTKKQVFNKLKEGSELAVTVDHLPADVAQVRLKGVEGDNDGTNAQFIWVSDEAVPVTETFSFNVIVKQVTRANSASNDESAVDQITFTLQINSDVTLVTS